MRVTSILLSAFLAFSAATLLSSASATAASKLNCKSDQLDQSQMNECANQDFLNADKDLNDVYKKAREIIKGWDDETGAALKAFVDGQKGWIAYRDGYCTAYAYQSHGGSMEPMLIAGCMASVTKARADELKTLVESGE
jgi:uncharacterized protein YecT (DUF1311 family)